jgi:hypothetical protein
LAREVSRSNHGGPCPPGGLGNVEVIVVDAARLAAGRFAKAMEKAILEMLPRVDRLKKHRLHPKVWEPIEPADLLVDSIVAGARPGTGSAST